MKVGLQLKDFNKSMNFNLSTQIYADIHGQV